MCNHLIPLYWFPVQISFAAGLVDQRVGDFGSLLEKMHPLVTTRVWNQTKKALTRGILSNVTMSLVSHFGVDKSLFGKGETVMDLVNWLSGDPAPGTPDLHPEASMASRNLAFALMTFSQPMPNAAPDLEGVQELLDAALKGSQFSLKRGVGLFKKNIIIMTMAAKGKETRDL